MLAVALWKLIGHGTCGFTAYYGPMSFCIKLFVAFTIADQSENSYLITIVRLPILI